MRDLRLSEKAERQTDTGPGVLGTAKVWRG